MKHVERRCFSHHFQAMGTNVDLWLWNNSEQRAQSAFRAVERFFVKTEARLTRFRSDSELSRLNRSAGKPFVASRRLFELVELALSWREQTDGIFDAAVLPALIASGYDRPFQNMLEEEPAPAQEACADSIQRIDSNGIGLGPGRQIWLPPGVALDLGGIAKGWTAQQAVYRLGMWGPSMVDAGGDIACVGAPPSQPWVVTVADPQDEKRDLAILSLNQEVVATSSRVRRRWMHAGKQAHHLIDPRTGAPAVTDLLSVTVVASRLPSAEIHAKTALILGKVQGLAYLTKLPDVSSLLVTEDGLHLTSGRFEESAYVPSTSSFAERFRTPT